MLGRDGRPRGFALRRVRGDSVHALIGLQSGDVINAINGHVVKTPEQLLAVYTGLASARHLTIGLTRRGKTLAHDYTIR